jgi:hypothetical protein
LIGHHPNRSSVEPCDRGPSEKQYPCDRSNSACPECEDSKGALNPPSTRFRTNIHFFSFLRDAKRLTEYSGKFIFCIFWDKFVALVFNLPETCGLRLRERPR